jgi:NodT family efflux transporter outer membrane factor (OMF) lipoprotein
MPVTVPDRWTAAKTPAEEVEGAWWTTFRDAALDRLVAEALENNHDLRATATRIEAATAQARIAGADLLPSVGVSLDGTRSKRNFIGFPIPGSSGGVLSTTVTTLGASLDTSWEADLWGRIRAGKAAALADVQTAQAEFEAARLSLAGLTAKAWFALAEVRQQVELAERSVESFRRTVDQVQARFEKGLRPSLDLRLALTNLHGAEAILQRRRGEQAALLRQLETLVGRYPEGIMRDRDTIPPVPPPVPAGLPADLIARRPDLIAAERRIAAADSRHKAARRALYPSFRLTASGGRSSEELAGLLDGNFSVWSLLASLTQPIFQGGRLRAGVDLADARVREAVESYTGAALRAYSEVETALVAETFLALRTESLAAASEQAAAARRLAEDRYNAGLDEFLTVLEAQRRDLEAESALLQVRRQRLDTRVDLHLALGGGIEPGDSRETAEETSS